MSPENPENLKIGLDAEKMGLDVGKMQVISYTMNFMQHL